MILTASLSRRPCAIVLLQVIVCCSRVEKKALEAFFNKDIAQRKIIILRLLHLYIKYFQIIAKKIL